MKKFIIAGIVGFSLVAGIASAQSYSTGSCIAVSENLSVGSRGSQVLSLQQFLVSQDYPGGGTWMETGYFGTATRAAVIDFQETQGLPQTGIVDSETLSALERVSCGGNSSTTYPYTTSPYTTSPYTTPYTTSYPYGYESYGTPAITSLSQNTGEPGQTITIYGQGFEPTNTVYFDGEALSGVSANGSTQISFTIPYITSYEEDQTVQLYVTNQDGTSNTVSFTLNPSTCGTDGCSTCDTYPYSDCSCSSEYSYGETTNCENCGTYEYEDTYDCQGNTDSPTITYLNPQSGGAGTDVTIYGSGFTTSNDTVHFGNGIITGVGSSDGESISFVVPSTITGYGSQPLTLGSYNVSVTNSNDITSNAVSFDVTSTNGNGSAPTITSVSGPTDVQTGVENTWEVTVNNPDSNYATVSVSWGDTGNGFVDQAAPETIYGGTQTVSYSHAYETAGTYTLTFTVANQNGQTNTYTETIDVGGSYQSTSFTASPSAGEAPLTVEFTSTAPQGGNVGSTVNFGDGTTGSLAFVPVCSGCSLEGTVTHTYESTGTYTATLMSSSDTTLGSAVVTVNSNGTSYGTPEISYLTPTSGYVGTQVTIYGSDFSTSGNNVIDFGSGAIQNVYSNGSYITFTVPSSVAPYCAPGNACPQYEEEITPGSYEVSVMDSYGTSNEVSFTVL